MLFRKKPKPAAEAEAGAWAGADGQEAVSAQALEQVKKERRNIVAVVRDSWVRFQPGRVAGKGLALAERVDRFVGPVSEVVYKRFPFMRWVPRRMFFEIVIVAVVESKTDSPDEVRKATTMLQMKYGRDY